MTLSFRSFEQQQDISRGRNERIVKDNYTDNHLVSQSAKQEKYLLNNERFISCEIKAIDAAHF